ncbi:hypothetical protein WJX81_003760 [Elliptochloris bilobata]|uniref:Chlorophyll a-b binding protein, chloroplastic n=1 Tax=Elliptochloris bilobata TaxID=381761 RepID=A0AAW1S8K2_9CHLO
MAASCFAQTAANLQACKARFSGNAPAFSAMPSRPAARVVKVRAEEGGKVTTTERKATNPGPAPLIFASEQSLSYLDGTRPADYGFDPLGLMDPEGQGGFINQAWLQYSEVIHARWAMLGAAGMIAPEILASAGVIPQNPAEVTWFRTGVIQPAGTYSYWTDPYSLFFLEVIAMQFAELKRWQDFRHPGSQGKQYFLGLEQVLQGSGNPAYPGGQFFNLFNLGKTPEAMKDLQTKELKNGRLAMLAVFGYGAQAVMTHEGPFKNLTEHLSNPTAHNILTNFSKVNLG